MAAQNCRSASRIRYGSGARASFLGFRLALTKTDSLREGPTEASPWTVPDPVIEMAWIAPGIFTMGSPEGEADLWRHDFPQTLVGLSQGFWIGKHEVTWGQWQALMGGSPHQFQNLDADAPVEGVSWDDATDFCRKLTERERAAGRLPDRYEYALPTEAQWEYACRAGTTGSYAGSGNVGEMAWYGANSGRKSHVVGQKQSNAWGLYDMHGNVAEWCADWFSKGLPGGRVRDPTGPSSGTTRVTRGGSYTSMDVECRSARRSSLDPGDRESRVGFRLALRTVQ
jgi:formylglycine-generating enzyme required for sulfatase activity